MGASATRGGTGVLWGQSQGWKPVDGGMDGGNERGEGGSGRGARADTALREEDKLSEAGLKGERGQLLGRAAFLLLYSAFPSPLTSAGWGWKEGSMGPPSSLRGAMLADAHSLL